MHFILFKFKAKEEFRTLLVEQTNLRRRSIWGSIPFEISVYNLYFSFSHIYFAYLGTKFKNALFYSNCKENVGQRFSI